MKPNQNDPAIRVFIADDDVLVRAAVRAILASDSAMSVAGEAGDGMEVLTEVSRAKADVLLLDQNMPNATGMSTLRELAMSSPGLRTLFLAVFLGTRDVLQSLILGGYGLVLKQDAQAQLLNAIKTVHRGAYWYGARSYNTANELVHALKPTISTEETPADVLATISPRDRKILEMLSAGCPNKEIAYELQTSEQVIKNSVRKLFGKFNVENRVELALYAVNHALVGDSN